MLKAVRLGYIENGAEDVLSTAKMAYEYIVANWVVDNGDDTMDWLGTVEVGAWLQSYDRIRNIIFSLLGGKFGLLRRLRGKPRPIIIHQN